MVQIAFVLYQLAHRADLMPSMRELDLALIALTAGLTVVSGLHYVIIWARRAEFRKRRIP